MISIENLAFSYGRKEVLRNINLELEKGRIYGLLGENGVGKTTLLTLLAGLKKPQEGSILADGEKPFDRHPSFLESICYLPDTVPAIPMKAADFAATSAVFRSKFDMDKFFSLMKDLDVDAQMKMNDMSAGQLKKTYISFALACNADYLLMDEPTNGLDIPSKTQLRSAITRYTPEDSTLVISTHQVRDLENIIDPIIILDSREVLLNASIEEISSRLYFDYGTTLNPDAFYCEKLPGGYIQVYPNTTGEDSKVNIEALFNTVLSHKEDISKMFKSR